MRVMRPNYDLTSAAIKMSEKGLDSSSHMLIAPEGDTSRVRIETRWATANAGEIRRHAAELAALAPDVILAHGGTPVGLLLQATRTAAGLDAVAW